MANLTIADVTPSATPVSAWPGWSWLSCHGLPGTGIFFSHTPLAGRPTTTKDGQQNSPPLPSCSTRVPCPGRLPSRAVPHSLCPVLIRTSAVCLALAFRRPPTRPCASSASLPRSRTRTGRSRPGSACALATPSGQFLSAIAGFSSSWLAKPFSKSSWRICCSPTAPGSSSCLRDEVLMFAREQQPC